MPKPLPWSYSALNSLTQCPHKHCEVKVLKHFKDESGEAAQWGTYVHAQIEAAIKTGAALPENCKVYAPQVWAAINGNLPAVEAEVKLAINTKFEPCPWEERWGGSISDVLKIVGSVAWIHDWKLGKVKPSGQLKVNALMVFYNYPEVNSIHTSFDWLNKSVPDWVPNTRASYCRADIPSLWDSIMGDLKTYVHCFKTDTWPKRPSGLCKNYCVVTTCEHCGGTKWKR